MTVRDKSISSTRDSCGGTKRIRPIFGGSCGRLVRNVARWNKRRVLPRGGGGGGGGGPQGGSLLGRGARQGGSGGGDACVCQRGGFIKKRMPSHRKDIFHGPEKLLFFAKKEKNERRQEPRGGPSRSRHIFFGGVIRRGIGKKLHLEVGPEARRRHSQAAEDSSKPMNILLGISRGERDQRLLLSLTARVRHTAHLASKEDKVFHAKDEGRGKGRDRRVYRRKKGGAVLRGL